MILLPSCQTNQKSAPEPVFVPVIYVPDVEAGQCVFVDAEDEGNIITPHSAIWKSMYLGPITDLGKIKEKFQRCKVWE